MGIESTNVSGIKKMIKTELRIRNTKKLASPGASWRTKERETWKGKGRDLEREPKNEGGDWEWRHQLRVDGVDEVDEGAGRNTRVGK